MNSHDELELRLRSWMVATAPIREPAGLVDAAMAGTEHVRQRPGLLVGTGLRRRWFALPAMSPVARLVVVAIVVLAALSASVFVGSQMLRSTVRPTRDLDLPTSDGVWMATGSLMTPRSDHIATLLKDGRVVVAGGVDHDGVALASAEIWDPATGRFTAKGRMATTRVQHTATLLPDGRVLVSGGDLYPVGGGEVKPLASAEIYDPTTGRFTPTEATPIARQAVRGGSVHALATSLSDGRVFIAGGQGPRVARIYDPATGRFTTTPPIPCGDQWYPSTLTTLADRRVLVTCLDWSSLDPGGAMAMIYDPASDSFSPTGSPVTENHVESAALMGDGRVLAVGHRELGSLAVDVFDPTTGAFEAIAVGTRTGGQAVSLADGRVLVIGRDGGQIFDPATETLVGAQGPSGTWFGVTATRLLDGRVLVAGSMTEAEESQPATVFDPGME
ncbi:MAG TPA: kelch repeat-containing protein [Candidatus Limnocylindrales bacterium]|nr:kelch repeat-containing protein [Candidatus Limnocylindrales bacterium]